MKKRSYAILIIIAIIVCMLSVSVSAANTQSIVVSPAEGLGVTWEIVKCDHASPEDLKVYSTIGIGWGKDGDIFKLVDEIDFGKGLVSLNVVTTCADVVPEGSKCVVKAGDVIIAEFLPVKTASWDDTIDLTATLKAPITGKQIITIEFIGGKIPVFGDITFEVTPANTATNAATALTTSALTSSAISNSPTSLISTNPTKAATPIKTPLATAKITTNPKNNAGLIIGIVCVVLIAGAATAFIMIKKKK